MKNNNKKLAIDHRKCIVFFDFDNTITTRDVFDDMLLRFSKDERWIGLEERWKKGKIGSEECLQGQIKGMRIAKKTLDRHLCGIKLDPYFKKLAAFLDAQRIKKIILSDNFDYILNRILSRYSLRKTKIYANRLKFAEDRLIPLFPFRSRDCKVCAHCKTKNLLANINEGAIIVYIGDGRSDVCPAKYADIVFAKKDLLKHYKNNCISYNSLKEVYSYLKRSLV